MACNCPAVLEKGFLLDAYLSPSFLARMVACDFLRPPNQSAVRDDVTYVGSGLAILLVEG